MVGHLQRSSQGSSQAPHGTGVIEGDILSLLSLHSSFILQLPLICSLIILLLFFILDIFFIYSISEMGERPCQQLGGGKEWW